MTSLSFVCPCDIHSVVEKSTSHSVVCKVVINNVFIFFAINGFQKFQDNLLAALFANIVS